MYADPDGRFIPLLIGAAIGGLINLGIQVIQGNVHNLGDGLKYFGVGAFAGALGAGVSSALAGGTFGAGFMGSSTALTATSSFISGAAIGGSGGFAGGFTTGFGNSLVQGQPFGTALGNGFKEGLIGGVSGGLIGGAWSGIDAIRDGRNFWHGGRLETDISMNLPQMNQVGELDCRYETYRSIDEYYNGSTTDVNTLKVNNPDVATNDAAMGKMYGKRRLSVAQIDKNPVESDVDFAKRLASRMSQNRAVIYEMKINARFAHATAINRIRVYDNGRIMINLMNPTSGAGASGVKSISNFRDLRRMFSVFKF